jgi:hypothetical protein
MFRESKHVGNFGRAFKGGNAYLPTYFKVFMFPD